MSAAIDKVLELLADGDWHPKAPILDALVPLMAPGAAYRRSEADRKRRQTRRGKPVTDRQRGDRHSATTAGARLAAADVVRGLTRRGQIEQRNTAGTVEVRALPKGNRHGPE